jgi:translation initiation factor 5B
MKEIRVTTDYVRHQSVKAAIGVKINAQGLDHAIAGSQILVHKPGHGPHLDDLKDEVQKDLATILSKVDKTGTGVCVQASTLGALEALLSYLADMKIPVRYIAIGPVHKKDIMHASIMLERKPEYAVILAFDVKIAPEAEKYADEIGVKIFNENVIYHLFEQWTAHITRIREERRAAGAAIAVYPCVLEVLPNCVFNAKNPIVLGCRVSDGVAKIGTPLCVPVRDKLYIGRITGLQKNHEDVKEGKKGDELAIKIEADKGMQTIIVGRQFQWNDQIVSQISRESINELKENFKDDVAPSDWRLIIRLKEILGIQ